MKDVIVITGPTASGKTETSVRLAEMIEGEIVSADSMQIFRRCDIGTAKPSREERTAVRHHLIDIVEPDGNFSTASYKTMAESAIGEIDKRGKRVVVTGGTGLYIDSLVKNIDFSLDDGAGETRRKYRDFLEKNGPLELHALLMQRDANAAASVHPNNTRRVTRYLEILDDFPGSMEEYRKLTKAKQSEINYRIFILWPERQFIYKRIDDRVDRMIGEGLVDEVSSLLESGITRGMQSMQGIGYKETIRYIENEINYEEYREMLKRNTRRYAKRQFTWMRRYRDAVRISVDEGSTPAELATEIYSRLEL